MRPLLKTTGGGARATPGHQRKYHAHMTNAHTPFGYKSLLSDEARQAAKALRVGDRVWFRHSKSGELAERVEKYQVVDGGRRVGEVPTYRGEGKAFL